MSANHPQLDEGENDAGGRRPSLEADWDAICRGKEPTDPHGCPMCGKELATRSHAVRHILGVHRAVRDPSSMTWDNAMAFLRQMDQAAVPTPAAGSSALAAAIPREPSRPAKTAYDVWQLQLRELPSTLPHQCPVCSKHFSNRSNAVQHVVRIHVGQRRGYTVERVRQYFESAAARIADGSPPSRVPHQTTLTTARPPADLTVVDALAPLVAVSTASEPTSTHMARWAKQLQDLPSVAPHQCPVCEKTYANRANTAQHIVRVHMGEKEGFGLPKVASYLRRLDSEQFTAVDKPSAADQPEGDIHLWEEQLRTLRSTESHRCPVCKKPYSSRCNAVQHIIRVHAHQPRGYTLDNVARFLRERSDPRRAALDAQQRWESQMKLAADELHYCPKCNAPCSSRQHFVRHFVDYHCKDDHVAADDAPSKEYELSTDESRRLNNFALPTGESFPVAESNDSNEAAIVVSVRYQRAVASRLRDLHNLLRHPIVTNRTILNVGLAKYNEWLQRTACRKEGEEGTQAAAEVGGGMLTSVELKKLHDEFAEHTGIDVTHAVDFEADEDPPSTADSQLDGARPEGTASLVQRAERYLKSWGHGKGGEPRNTSSHHRGDETTRAAVGEKTTEVASLKEEFWKFVFDNTTADQEDVQKNLNRLGVQMRLSSSEEVTAKKVAGSYLAVYDCRIDDFAQMIKSVATLLLTEGPAVDDAIAHARNLTVCHRDFVDAVDKLHYEQHSPQHREAYEIASRRLIAAHGYVVSSSDFSVACATLVYNESKRRKEGCRAVVMRHPYEGGRAIILACDPPAGPASEEDHTFSAERNTENILQQAYFQYLFGDNADNRGGEERGINEQRRRWHDAQKELMGQWNDDDQKYAFSMKTFNLFARVTNCLFDNPNQLLNCLHPDRLAAFGHESEALLERLRRSTVKLCACGNEGSGVWANIVGQGPGLLTVLHNFCGAQPSQPVFEHACGGRVVHCGYVVEEVASTLWQGAEARKPDSVPLTPQQLCSFRATSGFIEGGGDGATCPAASWLVDLAWIRAPPAPPTAVSMACDFRSQRHGVVVACGHHQGDLKAHFSIGVHRDVLLDHCRHKDSPQEFRSIASGDDHSWMLPALQGCSGGPLMSTTTGHIVGVVSGGLPTSIFRELSTMLQWSDTSSSNMEMMSSCAIDHSTGPPAIVSCGPPSRREMVAVSAMEETAAA
mgnify:CR=1 FL=1